MRRSTMLLGLAAALTGLVGCASPAPGGAVADAILASTAGSSLAPRPVTAYQPAAGTAPSRTYAVGRRDLTYTREGRPLKVRVWYPAVGGSAGEPAPNAEPASGAFPLVLFSHGLDGRPEDYAAMLARWAQAGFAVAAPSYPHTAGDVAERVPSDIIHQPADASYLITALLSGAELGAHLDPDRLAAAGHSAGGITTVGLFSAHRDARLKAGVVLNGTDFLGTPLAGPAAAMMFVHGRKDDTVAYHAGRTVFEAVPWSRAMLTITDGGHLTTGDTFEAITGTSTEFLRWSLYGDAGARARIAAAAARGSVATLDDQL